MSHFHFPRLHFSGKAIIDPATGNNNYHYPLVNFEPISGNVVLPPRIYLDNEENLNICEKHLVEYHRFLKDDEDGNSYIEISPISETKIFKKWMSSPMGSLKIDEAFHSLYENILTDKESIPLKGLCPAYWNYYGTMNFVLEDVIINKVQTCNQSDDDLKNSNTASTKFLGAQLSFDFKNGRTSAVMIDVSPSLSLFSQVFCSRISLSKDDENFMGGKPLKASLRQMNVNRVENDVSITGSSGSFYQTIPLENLNTDESKDIIDFFTENMQDAEKLKGISIRYDLSEVYENTQPDYSKLGTQSNPAELHINGTISPFLENEMISHPPGRRLDYLSAYKDTHYLGSCFAFFQEGINLLSLDLIGSLSQIRNDNRYELVSLGKLKLNLIYESESIYIGSIDVTKDKLSLQQLKTRAGIFDFKIEDPNLLALLKEGKGRLEVSKDNQVLLKEKELRILTDQTGIYADQFDDSSLGYFSNASKRETCRIKIRYRGKDYLEALKVMLVKVSVLPYGRGHKMEILDDIQTITHNQDIPWSTQEAGQFFYVFIPTEYDTMPLDIKHHILKTGEFVNLRVLPRFEREQTDNEIEFREVYNQILENFDLLYPASSIITPFNENHLSSRSKFLQKIMDEDYWSEYLYMPSSRDLPKGKRKLMFDWLAQQNKIK